jgi:hypothetical protein
MSTTVPKVYAHFPYVSVKYAHKTRRIRQLPRPPAPFVSSKYRSRDHEYRNQFQCHAVAVSYILTSMTTY